MRDCSLGPSLQAICDAHPGEKQFEVQLTVCVGVFCDPDTHPSPAELATWVVHGVAPVVGAHPRRTVNDREMLRLGGLLDRPVGGRSR